MDKILEEYNIWNVELDFGVDRLFAYPTIVELLGRKEIQVITGIRRCGKTTLMRQCIRNLFDKGVSKENILFIPCDNPLLKLDSVKKLHNLIDNFRKNKKEVIYVFLDEIQAINGWEKYLKSTYDANLNLKFVISGSTASFFASDVASLLTGRHFYHQIETLQYKEYLRLAPAGNLKEYLEWGGFPEVIKAKTIMQKEALLESYLNTIIQRDIIERYDVRNKKKLKEFIESLLISVGGKINFLKLSKQFEINQRSVERYIELAKDAFLLQEVHFFSYSKRKNRHMLPKVYPSDIGFTRILSKRFEQGRSAEWAVAHFLRHTAYWSDYEHEIDFVSQDYAIQVTLSENIPDREFESFKVFNKKKPLVLSLQTTDKTLAIESFLIGKEYSTDDI